MDDHDLRSGVVNHILELRGWVRHGKRHGDSAGAPDPPLDRHMVKAGGHEKSDARLLEVAPSAEQACGYPGGGLEQIAVGERAFGREDRRALGVAVGAGDQRELGHLCALSSEPALWVGRLAARSCDAP